MRSSQLVELCEKTGSMELPPFFILFIVADVTSVSNLRKFAMRLVRGSLAGFFRMCRKHSSGRLLSLLYFRLNSLYGTTDISHQPND